MRFGRHPVVWLLAALGVALVVVGRVLDAHGDSVAGAVLFFCGLACVPLMVVANWKTRP